MIVLSNFHTLYRDIFTYPHITYLYPFSLETTAVVPSCISGIIKQCLENFNGLGNASQFKTNIICIYMHICRCNLLSRCKAHDWPFLVETMSKKLSTSLFLWIFHVLQKGWKHKPIHCRHRLCAFPFPVGNENGRHLGRCPIFACDWL